MPAKYFWRFRWHVKTLFFRPWAHTFLPSFESYSGFIYVVFSRLNFCLFGLLNEPPWSFHELSWEREVLLSLAQQPELCSALTTLVTGCLCSGQLGEPSGWAGSCSRHMQSWLWPADQMACRHSHHVRLGHWEKQEKEGCSKAYRNLKECMWHCCEKAQEVNAWFHRLSNGLLKCTQKIGWICVTTSLPFRSPSLENISSARYKSNCSLCGFCIVCWHGAEPSFLRFAGQPTTILLFFHQSRRIFITLGVLDIYVWNLILICLYKHTNTSLTSPRGVNAWGNVWIWCSSLPLLPACSFTQKLLGSEALGSHPHQIS